MKPTTLLAIILIIASCKQKEPTINYTGFREKRVTMAVLDTSYEQKDTLATITLKIPNRLDTFYRWHQESDCTSCGWLQYRFADKKYPQFAESGWMWTYKPDSVYQFSIRHRPKRETPDSITNKPLTERDSIRSLHLSHTLSSGIITKYLRKDFLTINNQPFWLTSFITPYGYITNDTTLYVCAITNLKRSTVYFIGECSAKDTVGFAESIYRSIQSIEITER